MADKSPQRLFLVIGWMGVLLVAGLLNPAGGAEPPRPFKAMTFNIRYDRFAGRTSPEPNAWNHASGQHRRDKVVEVIQQTDADIVGLQEVLHNQLADLKERLPEWESYGVGRDDGKELGEYSPIFFRKERYKKLDAGTFWLCDEPDVPGTRHPNAACARIASWVILQDTQANDRRLCVINTHWDHVGVEARQLAARLVPTRAAELAKEMPLVLMGDMNAAEDSSEIAQLLSGDLREGVSLVDAYRIVHPERDPNEATFHGFTPRTKGVRIDYVFHTPEFAPKGAEIVRTSNEGRYPSDHHPVVIEYVWRD